MAAYMHWDYKYKQCRCKCKIQPHFTDDIIDNILIINDTKGGGYK